MVGEEYQNVVLMRVDDAIHLANLYTSSRKPIPGKIESGQTDRFLHRDIDLNAPNIEFNLLNHKLYVGVNKGIRANA